MIVVAGLEVFIVEVRSSSCSSDNVLMNFSVLLRHRYLGLITFQ